MIRRNPRAPTKPSSARPTGMMECVKCNRLFRADESRHETRSGKGLCRDCCPVEERGLADYWGG